MTQHKQPVVRWIPAGEHAGIYVYTPAHERWIRLGLERGTVYPGGDLPPGSLPLVPIEDID